MKTIKKNFLAAIIPCLIYGIVHAQHLEKIPFFNRRVEWATMLMQKKYHLDTAQYQSILVLNKSFVEKASPILLSDQSKMEKLLAIKTLVKNRDSSLVQIFNQEQLVIFKKVKEERRALLKAWLED